MIGSYLTTTFFLVFFLTILFIRSKTAFQEKSIRKNSLLLIGTTMAYVLMDGIFIACDLSGNCPTIVFKVVVFLFYVVYTALPLSWHIFTRNFVGRALNTTFKQIEYIPGALLLAWVLITPFTGLLYTIAEDGSYIRGPLYGAYSIINLFYYVEPLFDALVIHLRHRESREKYYHKSIVFSSIPLIATVINNFAIPAYQVYPFMPFCSVAVASLAFLFVASVNSDFVQESYNKEIKNALREAQEANRAKTKFLSNVSHDIRTPMNAIINLTELAQEESDINVVRGYLGKIDVSGRFLLGLIDDILDMSRIESGNLQMHKECLTRAEFLETVETVIRPLMKERNINFHLETTPGTYEIYVDRLRFNQIFFNLLSNAAKFTPEGGDVWFEIKNLDVNKDILKIMFVVRDNGIGMSEEFLEHIFEPFTRERSSLGNDVPGTGLGLSIVKNLVEAMDGTISVKSKLGEGSEFIATINVGIVKEDKGGFTGKAEEAELSQEYIEEFDGMNVLLAEDNELNVYVAKIVLEKAGCVVTVAKDGQEALDKFVASDPFSFDVILMDMRMPIMDGLVATQTIRELDRPDAASIPIIAVTADVFDEERMQASKIGITDYLCKPLDTRKLFETLDTHIVKKNN